MKKLSIILGYIFSCKLALCQLPVTDILQNETDKSSSPSDFVELNQKILFEATTENEGRELWVLSQNETTLLKDINPGKNNAIGTNGYFGVIQSYFSESSVIIENTLYFIANDGTSDGEIWRTDGTTEGTEKVTDFLNYKIYDLTLIDNSFYFLTIKNDSLQVWKSDGTRNGTQLVKDGIPVRNHPTYQGKCNNTFIFTFQENLFGGSKVWRSDGTDIGTYEIAEGLDGNGSWQGGTLGMTQHIEYKNELYFVSRRHLHRTDGTLENTKIVISPNPASNELIEYGDAIEVNGKLYFSFFESENNHLFIWETDGTEGGSRIIYETNGERYFMPSNLIKDGNSIFLTSYNNTGGTSLIRLNVTDYSVEYIKQLQDTSEKPFNFRTIERDPDYCILEKIGENKIFCSAPNGRTNKRKGWVSSLTESTTTNITDLDDVTYIINYGNSFFFSKESQLNGHELWRSNESHDNFFLHKNINRGKFGLDNRPLFSLDSNLVFIADDGLWSYDGTSINLLKDIRLGGFHYSTFRPLVLSDLVYFAINDSITGVELWKTNGTESGTSIVHDIIEGSGSSFPQHLTNHNGQVFFTIEKDGHYHLCKATNSDVEIIIDLGSNMYGVPLMVTEMKSVGDYLYLVTHRQGLWKSDGTESGTSLIKDFNICDKLTDVNGTLFFSATDVFKGEVELWKSDGTSINTKQVKDIEIGISSLPKDLFNFNGTLYFTAITNENGRELWKSDGSESGTILIKDIFPGSQSSLSNTDFCILNSHLYFSSKDNDNGYELWRTDGSENGTKIVKDINEGLLGSFPSELVVINNSIYFQAYDSIHGFELWKTDGTESGTLMVADILPGLLNSCPSNITSFNNDIYFSAETINSGRQIWKINPTTVSLLHEPLETNKLKVYPNPSEDFINLDSEITIDNISIFNSKGYMISFENRENNRINISHLPSGLYIIKLEIGGKAIIKKMIKN